MPGVRSSVRAVTCRLSGWKRIFGSLKVTFAASGAQRRAAAHKVVALEEIKRGNKSKIIKLSIPVAARGASRYCRSQKPSNRKLAHGQSLWPV